MLMKGLCTAPHLPTLDELLHSQDPTMVHQTPQKFYCLFQNRVFGWSAVCVEEEVGGTNLNGVSLGILTQQNNTNVLHNKA